MAEVKQPKRRRVKLILPKGGTFCFGRDARLVYADTGEDIPGICDMVLNLPLKAAATVTVQMRVDEIEVAKE